ncbi:MAG: hypothetical protein QW075_01715 [Thermofilaceae archaeon]
MLDAAPAPRPIDSDPEAVLIHVKTGLQPLACRSSCQFLIGRLAVHQPNCLRPLAVPQRL